METQGSGLGGRRAHSRMKRREDKNKFSSGQFHDRELAEAPGRGLRGLELRVRNAVSCKQGERRMGRCGGQSAAGRREGPEADLQEEQLPLEPLKEKGNQSRKQIGNRKRKADFLKIQMYYLFLSLK